MPRGNPNIAKIRKKRKSAGNRLYININENYGITVDNYNIIITKKYYDKNQDKYIPLGEAYYGTFTGAMKYLEKNGFSEEEISECKRKTEGLETYFDRGKLKIKYPEDFQSEPNPFGDGGSGE